MNGHLETLPDEADALKQVIAQLTLTIADLEHEKRTHQSTIDSLHEQLRLLQHHRFGRRSEKYDPNQLDLFNEPFEWTVCFDRDRNEINDLTEMLAKPKAKPTSMQAYQT